jgi:hypothetical protein
MWRFRAPVDLILLLKLANLGETLPEFKLDATPVLAAIAPAVALPAPALDDAAKALLSEPAEEQPAPEAVAGATAPAAAVVPAAAGEEPAGPDAVEAEAAPSGSAEPQPTDPADPADPAGPVAAAQQSAAAVAGPDTVGTTVTAPTLMDEAPLPALPVQGTAVDRYRTAFVDYTQRHGAFPDGDQLAKWLFEHYGITGRSGDTLSSGHLRRYLPAFREQWEVEQQASVSTPQ